MRRLRRGGVLILTATMTAACTSGGTTQPAPSALASSASPAAVAYLDAALNLMHDHALNRATLDWPKIRRQAYREASGAMRVSDVYPVIRLALLELDDNDHSSLIPPPTSDSASPAAPEPLPTHAAISRSIAYLSIPGNTSFNNGINYQRATETALVRAQTRSTCGWILDLRDNTGGNLWPMLIGVQSLLGTGTVGYFVPPGQAREPVSVTATTAADGTHVQAHALLAHDDLSSTPVAVVTGPRTASSGEFLTVAFRGRARTSSFGLPTNGRPADNYTYPLSDGAVLNLTVGHDADRTAHIYPDAPIPPQHAVPGSAMSATSARSDPAIHSAITWLRGQDPAACT